MLTVGWVGSLIGTFSRVITGFIICAGILGTGAGAGVGWLTILGGLFKIK